MSETLTPTYPTPAYINALPFPLRRYIHDLETRCDPAGDVRALALTRDENAALQALIVEQRGQAARYLAAIREWAEALEGAAQAKGVVMRCTEACLSTNEASEKAIRASAMATKRLGDAERALRALVEEARRD